MKQTYDSVIIGGGHNGLVCGAYLAGAGQKVLILERRHLVGGAAVTEELWPGFRLSTASFTMGLLQPRIMLDLELRRHGLEVLKPTPMFMPLEGGRSLVWHDDIDRVCSQIAAFSEKDAQAYPRYRAHMERLGLAFRELMFEAPPDIEPKGVGDVLRLIRVGWRHRGIGDRLYDLYDAMTLSAFDFLARWFESDEMRASLGFYASGGGANCGIKSPGSAYVLLRGFVRDNTTEAGGGGFIRGGMGSISESIAASGRERGMQIRTDAPVESVIVEGGRAVGVRLEGGETVNARAVISNASAQTLFRRLVGAEYLTSAFLGEVAQIRDESTVFKLNLALHRLPAFPSFDSGAHGFGYPAQFRLAARQCVRRGESDQNRHDRSHRAD